MGHYYIGLMSGTSVDAADAALVEFGAAGAARVVATHSVPAPAALRDDVLAASRSDATITLAHMGAINQRLGDWFAEAALAVMATGDVTPADVIAIGSHGQTLWHAPDAPRPFSLQLGSASRIAARTGCTVVADFRNADMAVGGQGAPLVPAFHRDLFAHPERARIVVNIGGIANITILPAGADTTETRVTGLDTGPGNALMDAWIQAQCGHSMDIDGHWAAGGHVHAPLLELLLQEPYLSRSAPKSTGREHFNLAWLQAHTDKLKAPPRPIDVQATLCEFSARTIAMHIEANGPGTEDVFVCGGGVHNTQLMARLTALLAPRPLATTATLGLNGDWVEAAAFAWLAMRRISGLPGNLPAVTGARRAVPLGAVHAPPL